MTIQNAKYLVGHLIIIEKLVHEIKIKRPHLNDHEAFSLAHAMIEKLQDQGFTLPTAIQKAS